MDDLIKALQIFATYKILNLPTHCSPDVLSIMGIHKDLITFQDQAKLERLGFLWNEEHEHFYSYRFGSA